MSVNEFKGILFLKRGKVFYTEVVYVDNKKDIVYPVTVTGSPEPDRRFVYLGNNKLNVHVNQLGSLVVKTHDGVENKIERRNVDQANQLYCNGHRAVQFVRLPFTVKLTKLCHEVRISY